MIAGGADRAETASLSSMAYAVIADDLSGACDAGVEFARRGLRTVAWLAGREPSLEADVHVVNTGSRGLLAADAADAVIGAAEHIKRRGLSLIYKKIDSTLKGPVRAEIDALLAAGAAMRVVVTPANPSMGRVVRDGRLLVRGIEPVPPVVLATLLGGTSFAHVTTATAITPAFRRGVRIVSCDAMTLDDLRAVAQAAAEAGALPVGSAGLAAIVAQSLAGESRPPREVQAVEHVTVIAGSKNPVTAAQVERLAGEPGVTVVRVDLAAPPRTADLDHGQGALLVTGGDTAAYALGSLDAEGIEIAGEIEPGVHWGFVIGGRIAGQIVATKPGGFGEPDTLVKACRQLRGTSV